jgi:hypothetical protein
MNGGDVALRMRIDRARIQGVADAARQRESERQRYERTATHDGLFRTAEESSTLGESG